MKRKLTNLKKHLTKIEKATRAACFARNNFDPDNHPLRVWVIDQKSFQDIWLSVKKMRRIIWRGDWLKKKKH